MKSPRFSQTTEQRSVLGRREFLRRGIAASVGTLGLAAPADADDGPRVRQFRNLGRTGMKISDISMGTSRTIDPAVVRHAFERGINYFDTAESYHDGASERAVGDALAKHRNRIFIATKIIARPTDRRARLMRNLEDSLKRLQTDHVDVYFNHAVNDLARLENTEWHELTRLAKQQGKIRFSGMSGHGGHLIRCLDYALDNDLVDVVLAAYNFGQDPKFYERFTRSFDLVANQQGLPRVLEKATAKGVGVIAMKTLMGGRLNDLGPYRWPGGSTAQAAFRWTLSNPHVDALIVSMVKPKQIDRYLGASGRASIGYRERRQLREYTEQNSDSYCRPGCDACADSCPVKVPIADVLRARMYKLDYRDDRLASDAYAKLGAGASPCLECAEAVCQSACPYGLRIGDLARSTARILG
ncbi:MAG: aldo/keto reductase [Myxococcota bacterium]